jgi:uncharacterized protein (TIGR02588 family)
MKPRLRSRAEWVTFACSLLLLLVVVTLIATQAIGKTDPAAPKAIRVGPTRTVGERFFVHVEVANDGDLAAENVVVTADLDVGSAMSSAEQTVPMLAGHEATELTFAFDDDPDAPGTKLVVSVSGYGKP